MDGILNICKPKGISSFKALSIAKARLAKELGILSRKLKVGHLGTLDPAAVGVLILLVGKATKLNQQLSADRKRTHTLLPTHKYSKNTHNMAK
jgi:tRNA pseudouridine55 synthase